ncbi:MAG TPA: hypothetical protein VGU24_11635 [Microvirga sp.]|nr:hypothetical protein [Microvirga sp.]
MSLRAVTDNVENMTLEILKAIQSDLASFRAESTGRFEKIEKILRDQRRSSAGMLVMMRATAGDFDERVREIEERVAALEGRTQ